MHPLPHPLQIVFGWYIDSAFALDRLQHDCHGSVSGGVNNRLHVVVFHMDKARQEGNVRLLVMRLARGRQGSQRPAVEGVQASNYLIGPVPVIFTVLAGQLQGALDCLRTAVAKEYPLKTTVFDEKLG